MAGLHWLKELQCKPHSCNKSMLYGSLIMALGVSIINKANNAVGDQETMNASYRALQ